MEDGNIADVPTKAAQGKRSGVAPYGARGVRCGAAAASATAQCTSPFFPQIARKSIANNSGYRYRLFHSTTKSASLESHMYVSGWLMCRHGPKYPQVSLHQALSGPDQDNIFCQDLIHCSGR